MNVTKFKELLKEKRMPIDPSPRTDMQYAKLMIGQTINFECQFDKGLCKVYRGSYFKDEKMCCCHSCLDYTGWLKFIYKCDINKYAKRYSIKTGFWRKDKGCILPYDLRSSTCVFHNCHEDITINYGLNYMGSRLREVEMSRAKELTIYQKLKKEYAEGV